MGPGLFITQGRTWADMKKANFDPSAGKICVNIGAGQTYLPGWANVDIAPHAEITLDLSSEKLPFDTDSVDVVFSYHTLEHIRDYLFALGEIHRVLKHGGWFLLGVPYVTSTRHNLVNPYHLHHFNELSFDFFDPEGLKGRAVEDNAILFRKAFHHFLYFPAWRLVPQPLLAWCRRHMINVVWGIQFGLVAQKGDEWPRVGSTTTRGMRDLYSWCLRNRVRYSPGPDTGKNRIRRVLKAALDRAGVHVS